jgi:putative tryptophan/tyrosine transport system substrate-binding protein
MDRRRFLVASMAVALATPVGIGAQQAGKVYRLGWLAPAPNAGNFESFRAALLTLGYVEGANVAIEQRYGDPVSEELARAAADIVRSNPDVVVTDGSAAAAALKRMGNTIAVVFISGDPVAMGLVPGLARPGANMTGLGIISTELNIKRLELLREAFPRVSRIGVLYESRQLQSFIGPMERAARSLGLELARLEVDGAGHIDATFAAAVKSRLPVIMAVASALFHAQKDRLVTLAAQHRIPMMYETRAFPEAGGLMSYGADVGDVFRRAASYVDRVLKGAKPGDLPVEQPTKFEFVINLKTAKALGISLARSVLARADQVIE